MKKTKKIISIVIAMAVTVSGVGMNRVITFNNKEGFNRKNDIIKKECIMFAKDRSVSKNNLENTTIKCISNQVDNMTMQAVDVQNFLKW